MPPRVGRHHKSGQGRGPAVENGTVTDTADLDHWNRVAGEYARQAGGDGDSFYRRLAPFLWDQFGDIAGRSVLDLGCGHGWLTERLHRAEARAIGLDGSTALIDIARTRYPHLDLRVHDLTLGLPGDPATVDRALAHMVVMDLPDLSPLLADLAVRLAPDGVLVLSLLHPAFFGQDVAEDPGTGQCHRQVRGYLEHEQRWIESFGGHTHYHRPLGWYITQLTRHGLAVTGLQEPETLPHHTRPREEWTPQERWFATIPTMLAIAARPARMICPAAAPATLPR
jgi:SAM-dependent methyltransferase